MCASLPRIQINSSDGPCDGDTIQSHSPTVALVVAVIMAAVIVIAALVGAHALVATVKAAARTILRSAFSLFL